MKPGPKSNPVPLYPENPMYVRSKPKHCRDGTVWIDGSVLFEMAHHHLSMNPKKEPRP